MNGNCNVENEGKSRKKSWGNVELEDEEKRERERKKRGGFKIKEAAWQTRRER